jgi:hypothetical protein
MIFTSGLITTDVPQHESDLIGRHSMTQAGSLNRIHGREAQRPGALDSPPKVAKRRVQVRANSPNASHCPRFDSDLAIITGVGQNASQPNHASLITGPSELRLTREGEAVTLLSRTPSGRLTPTFRSTPSLKTDFPTLLFLIQVV